jgi:hypothetical protein
MKRVVGERSLSYCKPSLPYQLPPHRPFPFHRRPRLCLLMGWVEIMLGEGDELR